MSSERSNDACMRFLGQPLASGPDQTDDMAQLLEPSRVLACNFGERFLRVKSLPESRHTKRTVMATSANNKCAMSGKQKIARPFAQLLTSLTFAWWDIGILLSVQFCFLNAWAPRSLNYLVL